MNNTYKIQNKSGRVVFHRHLSEFEARIKSKELQDKGITCEVVVESELDKKITLV